MEETARFSLRPYQRAVFRDQTSGVVVLHWSRQVGKSFTLAAWAVWRIVTRPGRLVTVLSNSRENGAEFLRKCAEISRAFDFDFETEDKGNRNGRRFSDTRMELRIRVHGRMGRIKVLAANPRTARGFSGDLILDEFAFHENSTAIWEAAEPILASHPDYLCRIASTGNGRHNMFYRMVERDLTTDGPGETRIQTEKMQDGECSTADNADGADGTGMGGTEGTREIDAELRAREYAGVVIMDDREPWEIFEQEKKRQLREREREAANIEHRTSNAQHRMDGNRGTRIQTEKMQDAGCKRQDGECLTADNADGTGMGGTEGTRGTEEIGNIEHRKSNAQHRIEETYYKSKIGFKVSRVPRTLAYEMGTPIYDVLTREETTPQAARARALDKRAYDQNYECTFADEQLTLLTYELIGAAERAGVGVVCDQGWSQEALYLMRQARHPLFVGFDVARKQDLSVITVVERAEDTHLVRGILRMRDMRLTEQELRLAEVCRLPQFQRAAIDMTGLGLGLFEHAQKLFGASRIQGINFGSTVPASRTAVSEGRRRETVRVTEALAMELLRLYEERRIEHPEDELLREDLRKPEKVTTPGGRVSIAATRDEAGHADHFWSLALAVEAGAGGGAVPFAWQSFPRRRGLII